ncbi:DEAD/DEAH box helicase [Microlunatus panaciterrae]|uniref:Superfamily II DNA or RNA helicase n=2 Tax=Microlunatus panaciterrae TaxID=400768 RepID=A0ABS2RGR1_9ACTN|nr:superfamily II DNA or RNA helicase [Microlunatus panaciterrae]
MARHLDLSPTFGPIPQSEIPDVLARHVGTVVGRELAGKSAEEQKSLVNAIIATYATEHDVLVELDRLIAVHRHGEFRGRRYQRPHTPLSETSLLTNSPGEPNISFEIKTELASADAVDLLCAFIRFAGVRIIKEQLAELRSFGIPLRVITTTYRGVTERRALDLLVRDLGAEVKVCYDEHTTRLHAKAWLIKRNSGYDTGFVGSSNLSRSALLDGLEWNVRISSVATPSLIRKFDATFETYWNSPLFETYDPDVDADRFDLAIRRSQGSNEQIIVSGLEVHARPHQELMLEALEAERVLHDRHRNLLVAATGTGKTVVAALDYRRIVQQLGRRPTLLFVAHRKEILEQSLRTYREVLGDGSFGELYVAGEQPSGWAHVFASVQSLSAARVRGLPTDAYEVVVIDEFHHAAAPSYQALLEHLRPTELLGLTATPERTDGFDVRDLFDGRSAFELRLWEALDQDLLCPFHYYGVADNTDLSQLEWRRGGYATEGLDNLYTGNDARARLVLRALQDRVVDISTMRALGFCVSVDHANYMARVFQQAGINSRSITGDTPMPDRERWLREWRAGDIQCVFTVDVFNEGVDVPTLDTILMLRPTESATVFQQQLGRGLRRADGKALLTVLDFIGQQRREFRFADRFRILTGASGRDLERQVDEGFGYLPSGAQIVLDEVSHGIVLSNIVQSLRGSRSERVRELRELGDVGLTDYLQATGRELGEVYAGAKSWTELRRSAGMATPTGTSEEGALLKKLWRLTYVDDPERAHYYRTLSSANGPMVVDLDERGQRYAAMLLAILWPAWDGLTGIDDGLGRLRANASVCAEIDELLEHTSQANRRLASPLGSALATLPLFSHATYHREEVLIATGWAAFRPGGRSPKGHASGVVWADESRTDVFFVTLRKEEADFSPQTLYRDYPISLNRFHWESQNATAVESTTGQRYLNHQRLGTEVLIFTRLVRRNGLGAAPYLCLGRASYSEHRGSRPIAITWDLERPMPADVFTEASVVAS